LIENETYQILFKRHLDIVSVLSSPTVVMVENCDTYFSLVNLVKRY